ncbi:MAG: hypothetical protein LEGION0403_FIIPPAGN_00360 [Legionella sp.]|uniref:hypothetical protein n=1 Tax=Legionella sp. TaxID=459 RepID=UPI003D113B40
MSEPKSKMPDLKELASMTSKLFGDIKTSVTQIIHDYKEQRAQSDSNEEAKPTETKAADQSKSEEEKK